MKSPLLASAALAAFALPAAARAEEAQPTPPAAAAQTPAPAQRAAFTTGVAKGRDLLDTAISASTITSDQLARIGTPSIAEVVGNIPGIRAETSGTDGMTSITIRGLPLAADGAKYLQIEEDGLPVLEFGDVHFAVATQFLRTDLTLAQVQAIRGGSASTFASNSPGGVVNFLSRTGEEEGGSLQVSSGLDYALGRVDFDYGGHLDPHLRFNVGGYYRQGEGPRSTGYDAFRGGQIKLNLTRTFDGGYVRVYAKLLDDREPAYGDVPLVAGGTNANPRFSVLPGFDARHDTMWSRYIPATLIAGATNAPTPVDLHQGDRSKVRSVGIEAQFDIAGWTVTDRFRYAAISGVHNETSSFGYVPAAFAAYTFGGPGASLTYADGPLAGQPVVNPAALNGNGLSAVDLIDHADLNSLDAVTNDVRASRVFGLARGKLTTTAGLYASSQDLDMLWSFVTALSGYAGGGASTLLDVTTAAGFPVTQNGVLAYSILGSGGAYHRLYNVNFRVLAPYGSANYQIGKLALGGSVRYDFGRASGAVYGSDTGLGAGVAPVDLNGNGAISYPESQTAVLPLGNPGPVGYRYGYLSWSVGVNYRAAEALSVFARYSKGARASAERNLFPPSLNPLSGQLSDPSLAYSVVKQAEGGLKFRRGDITVFVTGFWASTGDINYQVGANAQGKAVVTEIDRTYSAKGVELETEARHGPFSLRLGATYTKAKIDSDVFNPAEAGLTPRNEPKLFFTALPQFETRRFAIGANVIGQSNSWAQDNDVLRQPGYVLVNPFVLVRPVPRLTLMLNVYNAFNRLALVTLDSAAIPAGGVVNAQVLNGRTVTGAVRFSF